MYSSSGNLANIFGIKATLVLIAILVIFIAVMWFLFLRPVPVRETTGQITAKTFKPAGQTFSYPYGANRGFKTPTAIETAAGYILSIHTDALGNVGYFANEAEAASYTIERQVSLRYETRGIPFIWSKVMVLEVLPH